MISTGRGARGAQVMAVAAVAAVGWYVAARSVHDSLSEARAELTGAIGEVSSHEVAYGPAAGDPAKAMEQLKEREARVASRAKVSGDAAKVYEALGTVAASCNVRVDRIEPVRSGVHDQRGSSSSARDLGFLVSTEATHYVIDAVGHYSGLAKFVSALERDMGLTRVVSMRLSPAPVTSGDGAMITASIETAHYKLVTTVKPAKEGAK